MSEPPVHDTPVAPKPATPVGAYPEPQELAPEAKHPRLAGRSRIVHHPTPLFPEHAEHHVPPSSRERWKHRMHELLVEAVTERKNQIPLGLIILLAIVAIVLLTAG